MNFPSPQNEPMPGPASVHALDHRTWAALRTLFAGIGVIAVAVIGFVLALGGTFAETSLTEYAQAIFYCWISVIGIRHLVDGVSRLLDIFFIHRARQKEHFVPRSPDHVDIPGIR